MGQTLPVAVIPALTPEQKRDLHHCRMLNRAMRATHDVLQCAALRARIDASENDSLVLSLKLARMQLLSASTSEFSHDIQMLASAEEASR